MKKKGVGGVTPGENVTEIQLLPNENIIHFILEIFLCFLWGYLKQSMKHEIF